MGSVDWAGALVESGALRGGAWGCSRGGGLAHEVEETNHLSFVQQQDGWWEGLLASPGSVVVVACLS